jgi:hypothetical protein
MDVLQRFRAKLDRAAELVDDIHAGLNAYHESGPVSIGRANALTDPPRAVFYIEALEDPPLRLAVLVGEFIHNLRSALDHLVWQLALTSTATPSETLQFPIYTAEPARPWADIVAHRLADVPDEAVDLIYYMQPWRYSNPEDEALAVVRTLSNEDKHRVLLEVVSAPVEPDQASFDATSNFDVAEDMEMEVPWGAAPSGQKGDHRLLHADRSEPGCQRTGHALGRRAIRRVWFARRPHARATRGSRADRRALRAVLRLAARNSASEDIQAPLNARVVPGTLDRWTDDW